MPDHFKKILADKNINASAPCRIDLGGTLDISAFYYPLRHLLPATFNIAIDLRTQVSLLPYHGKLIKVSSTGFKDTEYILDKAPFYHPLGLMFAIAAYFRAEGIHVLIESTSPPRSALGGSSAAAVALIGAFLKLSRDGSLKSISRKKTAILAHELESSVAGVPCGLQDQLAAAYGGVNAWYWGQDENGATFKRKTVVSNQFHQELERHLLVAYCGIPHESKNINQKWINHFLAGKNREIWAEIVSCTQKFIDALSELNYQAAAAAMNMEMAVRKKMTPDVLDDLGEKLVQAAIDGNCGARFTGAGGGGCIWAIGASKDICSLKENWTKILAARKEAGLLNVKIDSQGLL